MQIEMYLTQEERVRAIAQLRDGSYRMVWCLKRTRAGRPTEGMGQGFELTKSWLALAQRVDDPDSPVLCIELLTPPQDRLRRDGLHGEVDVYLEDDEARGMIVISTTFGALVRRQ